ncbi:hypothetical protein LTR50_000609 [Elasticomyces elasticus]|nr:hypothetical protein LTR50_000609 [Elasticomyces elasticus]
MSKEHAEIIGTASGLTVAKDGAGCFGAVARLLEKRWDDVTELQSRALRLVRQLIDYLASNAIRMSGLDQSRGYSPTEEHEVSVGTLMETGQLPETVPPRPSCLVACLALYERTDKVATKLEVARTIVILLRALGSRARTDHASEEPRDATDAESRTSRRHLICQLLLRVPHVLDPLFFAVRQDMPQVRSSAIFALGIVAVASQQHGAQEAPGPLLSCLLRQDEGARKAITDALAETVEEAERSDGADEVLKGDAANARAVLLSLGRLSVMSS